MKVRKVKVLRPFYFNRELQSVGKVLELPETFAMECVGSRKVELVEDAAPIAKEIAQKDDKGKGEKK